MRRFTLKNTPAPVSVVALVAAMLACGACADERLYMDPNSGGWGAFGGGDGYEDFGEGGGAVLRGDVGEILAIDAVGYNGWFNKTDQYISFTGDVPHQSRPGSTVYVSVSVDNVDKLPIGGEVRQQSVAGDIDAGEDVPVMQVYICPNGEGISGDADDIVLRRVGPESYTFEATSSVPEQNLNVNIGIASEAEMGLISAPR